MKKIILSLFLLVLLFNLSAQDVFFVETIGFDSIELAEAPIDTFTIEKQIYFYQTGNTPVSIYWRSDDFAGTQGWTLNICEDSRQGGACFNLPIKSSDTTELAPNDTSYLKPQFIPSNIVGEGFIPVTIEIVGVPNSEKTFNYYLKIDSFVDNETSINEIKELEFSLYPNPATDAVTISLPATNQVVNLNVYNVLGKEVLNRSLSANSQNLLINTSDYKAGVYIVKLMTASGSITTTTFVVK